MVDAVAAAAAIVGLAVVGVQVVRRHLVIRARIARRLAPIADPVAERLLRIHAKPIVPAMTEKADPA